MIAFDDMGEMAQEFVGLNQSLVRMRPDDTLRAMEHSSTLLRLIRHRCEFVGYDQIRRGSNAPILGMSLLLRCWAGSARETPSTTGLGVASSIAASLDANEAGSLITFLQIAEAAWGRDPENNRLWGGLNLTMCMWLWRRLVLDRERATLKRVRLNEAQFKKCLMRTSASGDYVDWLHGRQIGDRDRSPCYARLCGLFVSCLRDAGMEKVAMPKPAWASHTAARKQS